MALVPALCNFLPQIWQPNIGTVALNEWPLSRRDSPLPIQYDNTRSGPVHRSSGGGLDATLECFPSQTRLHSDDSLYQCGDGRSWCRFRLTYRRSAEIRRQVFSSGLGYASEASEGNKDADKRVDDNLCRCRR